MQTLTILGSTGSIGTNTLDIIARHPNRFQIFALTGHHQIHKLAQQCIATRPRYAVVADEHHAQQLQQQLAPHQLPTEVLFGTQALIDVATASEVNSVMAAIVGAAGLLPTLAAAKAGKTIYLANKETLVVAGSLFMETAQQHHATILPIDSEHNAIYQVLPKDFTGNLNQHGIHSIILTASGGPFLNTPLAHFPNITPKQATQHPNWQMGQKISIDSATMMNKGLELIEAHWLFNCPPSQLEVIIHPQSIIHSMVRYIDGSVLAQMSNPDMRTPIAHCLGLPERIESGVAPLNFSQLTQLTFQEPDQQRFPCLNLAYQALHTGNLAPCILNAANEIAVAAFLNQQIKFTDIAPIVAHCLEQHTTANPKNLDDLITQDRQTRQIAQHYIHHKK